MTTTRIPLRAALSLAVCALALAATPAAAQIRWKSDFSASDLKEWVTVQCGGQGTTCPCNDLGNTAGSCSTSNTSTPISSSSGRFQVRTEGADKVLRVELRKGDN